MEEQKKTAESIQARPSRLIGFSDGVLAIVVTLLVLGIDIPEDRTFNQGGLILFLKHLEPSLIAYVSSFLLVSIYWMQHHLIFHFVNFTNATLIWLNIFFLMMVSLLPFVSKLKALYKFDAMIVIIFAVSHILCSAFLLAMWHYVIKHPKLLEMQPSKKVTRWATIRLLISPLICALAIIISIFKVEIGTYVFLLIPIYLIYSIIKPVSVLKEA